MKADVKISSLTTQILCQDCVEYLTGKPDQQFDLTFLDPPFNQGKDYNLHNDEMPDEVYWEWMTKVSRLILYRSSEGAALYFMQREKNTERVLRAVREAGWTLQNVIIWKKKTSAVPGSIRYGKHYQVIAFATKGARPRVFNRLRIDPPLPVDYQLQRQSGVFLTDVWDDIRELTSGYFAGDEALRTAEGDRFHKQQSPVHLLLRIILSSSRPGDTVFDPFAGTGTTLTTALQLYRHSFGTEIDPSNVKAIENRIQIVRPSDSLGKYLSYYKYTPGLEEIWLSDADSKVESIPKVQLSILR